MRGQAFIIFRDINSAMEAKRRNHGRELYGKTMVSFTTTRKYTLLRINQMSLLRLMAPSSSGKKIKMTSKSNSNKNSFIALNNLEPK